MSELIAKSRMTAVVGLGLTGQSVARFLAARGDQFMMFDTRQVPPALQQFQQDFPHIKVYLGDLDGALLAEMDTIILSPGVALDQPGLQAAQAAGVPILGDIDLFLLENSAPIVAITGSNAKSTVTTLVAAMAQSAGMNVAMGGNIGTPVLDLLGQTPPDLVVLELSSFQLETLEKLNATVATVLNVSEDHMDRYTSMSAYYFAKQRIYFGAQNIVSNRADPLTVPPVAVNVQHYTFGLNRPDRKGFGLIEKDGVEWLAYEFTPLMATADVRLPGRHNIENALAALALGHAVKLPMPAMLATLREFKGLPHRCEWVAEHQGVDYYNDSKGTNVGATLAALTGLSRATGKVVLIAGGVGKGADFSPLAPALSSLRALVLMGEDAEQIATVASDVDIHRVDSMQAAVKTASQLAISGDIVLLSPACASFDMFDNYEHRGHCFVNAVRAVAG